MQRVAIFPLLGPALVCYLIADIASSLHQLDALALVIAATSIVLSLASRFRQPIAGVRTDRLMPWLGLSVAVSLLAMLTDQPLRISVEVSKALALSSLGALVLDFALTVPDRLGSLRFSRSARMAAYVLAGSSALASVLAFAPPFEPFGRTLLLPARYANASACFAALCVVYAFCMRLARPRLGSSPDALASNAWGLLALTPAAVLVLVLALGAPTGASAFMPLWAAASACVLHFGHVFMVDPKLRLSASRVSRDSMAAAGTIVLVASGVAVFGTAVPRSPLPLALWASATLLLAIGLFFSMRTLARKLLAPFGARMLDALADVELELAGAQTLDELARIVLGALRRASGSTRAQPLLYGFEPLFEARLDAAGAAHMRTTGPHEQLMARLQDVPGEILVRATLEARIARSPRQRPLLEALQEYDVLCVVPLMADGELEGAFFVPRGSRTVPLTLEELNALLRHARWLSGLFTLFARRGRAESRAHAATIEINAAAQRIEGLQEETARARDALSLLHAGRLRRAETPTLVAYSPAMRALVSHLHSLATLDAPVLFWAEPGLPVEPLARFLHAEATQRPAEPFIVVDCSALRLEQAEVAIFGKEAATGQDAGCLRAADGGTLLLLDVVALPRSVQLRLAVALTTGVARPASGGEPYRMHARVLASSREQLSVLVEQGRFEGDLAAPFESFVCRVPPLRECPEDFESHALLAIDRACRRLAREPLGIEADALARLRGEPWPENVAELQAVLDRAVAVTRGVRVGLADLAGSLAAQATPNPLEAPLEEVERRALLHAITRAGGNKSEAARLLGIPRTTLLDKLRRHKLEEGARDNPLSTN